MKDTKTLKWIFKKTKSQNINFVLLNTINIICSVLSIYLIVVSKNIIDSAGSGLIEEFKINVIRLITLALVGIALRAILSAIDAIARAKLEIDFKQDVLKTIINKNYERVSKFHSGELMTRIVSDVNVIIDTLISLIPNILSMVTRLICATWLLFKISKEFVFVLLIGGVVLFIVANLFKPYLKSIHKKVQEASSNVRLFFKEVFENMIVIKIFGVEDAIENKSNELQKTRYSIQMKRRRISIISSSGFNAIFQIVYLYSLIWCSYNLYLGKITIGSLTSIVQLILQVQSPIIGLSKSFQDMFAMIGSAERIIELEELEEDKVKNKVDNKELYKNLKSICLKNINFSYKNKKVLENANLKVKKDEIIAIYGESGIGKSTLLKLVLGIIEKDSGDICFEMSDGTYMDINSSTRPMFAYVPQGKFILSGTIRENITFVNKNISKESLNKSLEVSCAKSFIDELPDGLDTKIGERGSGLSEGQIQRLAIARAIACEAPILILDEITSSLDQQTEMEVLNNIKNLHNRTCIIVAHRNNISTICDRKLVIEDGRIKEE